jgi:polygalacturonase
VDESFALAVPLAGGNMTGPLTTPSVNGVQSPQSVSSQTTLQEAMSTAGTNGAMEIPPTYAGTDGFTNVNGIYVADLRSTVAQQYERSVKEFGAVCDGATDDTNALQAAINYAQTHAVSLTIPEGTCKTHTLSWHGESMGRMC